MHQLLAAASQQALRAPKPRGTTHRLNPFRDALLGNAIISSFNSNEADAVAVNGVSVLVKR